MTSSKSLALLMPLAALTVALNCQADDQSSRTGWKKINLTSSQQTQVEVDYQVVQYNGDGETVTADPIWINVTSSARALTASDQVRVVLNNYISFNGDTLDVNLVNGQTLDLAYAGNGRFTKTASPLQMLVVSDDGEGAPYISTLSVVVDGVWQTNPLPIRPGNFNSGEFLLKL